MTDLPLFDFLPEQDPEAVRKFLEFHEANPEIYELFTRFAFDAIRRGRPRFSARTIGERIRWYTAVETTGDDYKVNDHWWPFYARLFLHNHPEHGGFFEFRKANADKMTNVSINPPEAAPED